MKITDAIARSVGTPLSTAETTWQAALRDGGTMLAAVAQAAIDAQAGVGVVSDLADRCLEGLAHLAAAGRTYAGLHDRVSALARLSGLDPTGYGMSTPPPQSTVTELPVRAAA